VSELTNLVVTLKQIPCMRLYSLEKCLGLSLGPEIKGLGLVLVPRKFRKISVSIPSRTKNHKSQSHLGLGRNISSHFCAYCRIAELYRYRISTDITAINSTLSYELALLLLGRPTIVARSYVLPMSFVTIYTNTFPARASAPRQVWS